VASSTTVSSGGQAISRPPLSPSRRGTDEQIISGNASSTSQIKKKDSLQHSQKKNEQYMKFKVRSFTDF
jgi:hypothetical protein